MKQCAGKVEVQTTQVRWLAVRAEPEAAGAAAAHARQVRVLRLSWSWEKKLRWRDSPHRPQGSDAAWIAGDAQVRQVLVRPLSWFLLKEARGKVTVHTPQTNVSPLGGITAGTRLEPKLKRWNLWASRASRGRRLERCNDTNGRSTYFTYRLPLT